MCCRQLWFCAGFMQCLTAGVQAKIQALCGATEALGARMALTGSVVGWRVVSVVGEGHSGAEHTRRVAFLLGSVLLVTTVALGVVGLGLARTATVLALFHRTPLGVDVVKLAIYEAASVGHLRRPSGLVC